MKWSISLLLFLLLTLSRTAYSQITFVVQAKDASEVLIGAHIEIGEIQGITDIEGKWETTLKPGNYTAMVSYVGYKNLRQSISISTTNQRVELILSPTDILLEGSTVTASKYEVSRARSTTTIEVISPDLLKRNNSTTIEKGLQLIPGVDIIDRQPNIRGGSGYSYGAGSRVLILLDDIPILQADAGFPQWNDLPIELTKQIEILKGASSALYGSSALNGIINLRTDYATSTPETKFTTIVTAFDAPGDTVKQWADKTPFEVSTFLSSKQKVGNTDLVFGMFGKNLTSYNKGADQNYWRFTGSVKHKFNPRLSLGVNFNANRSNTREFFYWKSLDSLFVGSANSYSEVEAFRYNIDPRLTYFDGAGNRHKILSRYHFVDNQANAGRSNSSKLGYAEYQFMRPFKKIGATMNTGVVNVSSQTQAQLYGDTTMFAQNNAIYWQWDQKVGERLTYSVGARYERNVLKAPELFNCKYDDFLEQTICDTLENGRKSEARPVFRAGLNYQLAKATYVRASWGQGYRYPTIAEQFITTNFGGIPISPNAQLESETGWSAELGIKQGYKLKGYNGFLDLVGFRSDYQNMMEFNFVDLTSIGFQSINVGNTQITGIEATLAGQGTIDSLITIDHIIGFTHIVPVFASFDTLTGPNNEPETQGQANAYNSSSNENVLKYRFNTTFKFDIQLSYKKWSIGGSGNYYSHMQAVDAIFEDLVVPGLKQYRSENNTGELIFSARMAYEINKSSELGIQVNNLSNNLYSLRPGLMDAPRNLSVRFQIIF